MNVFNRVVVIILAVVVLLAGAAVAAIPVQALTGVHLFFLAGAGTFSRLQESNSLLFLIGRVLLGLVCLVLVGCLLWAELRRQGPQRIKVHTQAGSQAQVTADAVARRLAWHINQLADVNLVTPHVRPRGQAVDILLALETTPDIDVPIKTDEVVACAKEILVERMGLQAGRILVQIDHAPYKAEA